MAGVTSPADNTPSQMEQIDLTNPRVIKHIVDALALAQHAIESGAKTKEGRPLPSDVIVTIQATAATLGFFSSTQGRPPFTTKAWTDFELAYYRLATLMSPVTAETLENTKGTSSWASGTTTGTGSGKPRSKLQRLGDYCLGFSPAQRFARGLWLVAIGFALFVVGADWGLLTLGQEADASRAWYKPLLDLLIPWAYGGLGSCAYLLRSAHTFIYQRSFDLRRKPEYFNRILLGAISGGAIILFMKYLLDAESGPIQLSAAALGFVAGYSTDFLFNTIERIVAAIFPKVADTAPPASPELPLAEATPTPSPEPAPPEPVSSGARMGGAGIGRSGGRIGPPQPRDAPSPQ